MKLQKPPQWHDTFGRVNLDKGLGRAGFMHIMDFRTFDPEKTEVSLARMEATSWSRPVVDPYLPTRVDVLV